MNPGYLGSLSAFTHKYVNPIEKGGDPELVEQVQKLIRPFLLRRVKKDPAIQLDLPDKTETKAYVSLTLEQASLYENVVQDLMNRIDSLTGMEKKRAHSGHTHEAEANLQPSRTVPEGA